ncbi:hypothetical protein J7M22_17910, partial [Candidatus Poribacteria bacterium]|nr:hypothetical protein [Candidatus Poribacteria bacterium]
EKTPENSGLVEVSKTRTIESARKSYHIRVSDVEPMSFVSQSARDKNTCRSSVLTALRYSSYIG